MTLVIPPDCETYDCNYIVDIQCPDGSVCKILIPIDPESYEGRSSRHSEDWPKPVGLNLVCSDHYT